MLPIAACALLVTLACAGDDGAPPTGTVEFMGVRSLVTVVGSPQFPPVELNIKRHRFNQVRDEAGISHLCDRAGLVLNVVSGPTAAELGLLSFVVLRVEVLDNDFGSAEESEFCDNGAIMLGLDGECPPA